MHKIVIIGLGYIGLPTAIMLANAGHSVVGVDVDDIKVEKINRGELHFPEPGLQTALTRAVENGKLKAQKIPSEADVFIICVPTPLLGEEGLGEEIFHNENLVPKPGLSYVKAAGEAIVPYLKAGNLVLLESTSPVGTTREFLAPILERSNLKAGRDFHLAYCPERVLPGRILDELTNNDRIVGGLTPLCAQKAQEIYRSFCKAGIFLSTPEVAEIVKLAENSYRDVNIAFANELAGICEAFKVSPLEVIHLANRHPRVEILSPGPGVGGHCIPIDPWFLVDSLPDQTRLLKAARLVNEKRPYLMVEKIESGLKKQGKALGEIACFGLTYKNDVDDIRESPAMKIAELLSRKGHKVRAYDPLVKPAQLKDTKIELSASPEDAVKDADLLALLVDHQEFKGLSPRNLKQLMRGKIIIDTRGIWLETEVD